MDEDLQLRLDAMERRILERLGVRLDAITVDTAMVLRHEARIKEHEEWLRKNELAAAKHRDWLLHHDAMMASIDKKLDRITDLMRRDRGGDGNEGIEPQ